MVSMSTKSFALLVYQLGEYSQVMVVRLSSSLHIKTAIHAKINSLQTLKESLPLLDMVGRTDALLYFDYIMNRSSLLLSKEQKYYVNLEAKRLLC